MNWFEEKSEDRAIGGFQVLDCTLEQHNLVGCVDLARFIFCQMILIAHVLFPKEWAAAYGAMYQEKVLRAKVCWQRGIQKDVNIQSSS